MSTFNFTLPNGEAFTLKGPAGMTFEQAQAIFKQQTETGSLTGFKVGDVVSSATQAADGLAAAAPQLSQGLASAAGLLPKGIDAGTINSAVGPGGAAVNNQIASALTGAGPAVASLTTGASAGLNSAVSGITAGVRSGFTSLNALLPGAIATTQANLPGEINKAQVALPGALAAIAGTATSAVSVASNAFKSLTSSLSGTPTAGIDISNLAKQVPSLGGIGNLSSSDVTATLAQASKLVGQGTGTISNDLGLGKFGFDASQLERAGFIKPGTAAQFLNQGANELTDVLKSPTVWTGKDGVKGIDNLLGNASLQDKIQQDLMASGLGDLKQIGIPTDKLTPQALSGLATNAAKSVEDAAKWATGGALPPGIKSGFDSMATNGAFAVNLAQGTAEQSVLKERVVEPSSDTVNADTVNAAAARIVGNDKVPEVTGSDTGGNAAAKTTDFVSFVNETYVQEQSIADRISTLLQSNSISQDTWNTVNQEFILVLSTFNARIGNLESAANNAINSLGAPENALLAKNFEIAQTFISTFLLPLFTQIKQLLTNLANKINTVQNT